MSFVTQVANVLQSCQSVSTQQGHMVAQHQGQGSSGYGLILLACSPQQFLQLSPQQVSQPSLQQVLQPSSQQVLQPSSQQVLEPSLQQVLQPSLQQVLQPSLQQSPLQLLQTLPQQQQVVLMLPADSALPQLQLVTPQQLGQAQIKLEAGQTMQTPQVLQQLQPVVHQVYSNTQQHPLQTLQTQQPNVEQEVQPQQSQLLLNHQKQGLQLQYVETTEQKQFDQKEVHIYDDQVQTLQLEQQLQIEEVKQVTVKESEEQDIVNESLKVQEIEESQQFQEGQETSPDEIKTQTNYDQVQNIQLALVHQIVEEEQTNMKASGDQELKQRPLQEQHAPESAVSDAKPLPLLPTDGEVLPPLEFVSLKVEQEPESEPVINSVLDARQQMPSTDPPSCAESLSCTLAGTPPVPGNDSDLTPSSPGCHQSSQAILHPSADSQIKDFGCNECSKQFDKKRLLVIHFQRVHLKIKRHTCELCGKTFASTGNHKEHLTTHSSEKNFSCKFCTKGFKRKSSLWKHMKLCTTPKDKFSCQICKKSFPVKDRLELHMFLHQGDKPFKCTECHKAYCSKNGLYTHKKTAHSRKTTLSKPSSSDAVSESGPLFASPPRDGELPSSDAVCQQSNAARSRQSAGSQGKNFCCNECSKWFAKKRLLVLHLRVHDKRKLYTCELCGKQLTTSCSLKSHLSKHYNTRNFTCSFCNKSFYWRSGLSKHSKACNKPKDKFSCTFCWKTFPFKDRLDLHMFVHQGEKPFKCSDCHKSFCSRHGLRSHKRSAHLAEKHTCLQCGKMLTTRDSLREHVKYIHSPVETLFQCTICKKSFARKKSLINHFPIHTNARPYSCTKCGMKFKTSHCLKFHMNVHAPVKPVFDCPLCKKQLNSLSSKRCHQRLHEPPRFQCSDCNKGYPHKYLYEKHKARYRDGSCKVKYVRVLPANI